MKPEERFVTNKPFPPPPGHVNSADVALNPEKGTEVGEVDIPDGLLEFLTIVKSKMLKALKSEIHSSRPAMRRNPDLYKMDGDTEPTIDVRLCVNGNSEEGFDWQFRVGSVDYDESHSDHCAAGCFGLDTKANDLLEELIGQIE